MAIDVPGVLRAWPTEAHTADFAALEGLLLGSQQAVVGRSVAAHRIPRAVPWPRVEAAGVTSILRPS